MEYNSVAILLTENCNASCKMCCDSRGRVRGKTLSKSEIETILSNINDCPTIQTIGITGGEPMLYPDLCEYIFNYPFDREVSFTIKTNGFWGKNKEKANNFLKRNKNKIAEVSFSYDEFHKEFIDIKHLKTLIDLCLDNEIYTNVVGCFLKTGLQPGDILNEFGKHAYKTEFFYQPVVKTGSASDFDDSQLNTLINTEKHKIKCIIMAKQDYTLLINPKLDIYPCCSQFIENTILRMGNLNEESLSSIVSSIKFNKVIHTFFTQGFTPFIEFMKKNNIDYPKNLTSHCELCGYLFSNEWFLEELMDKNYYGD